MQKEWRILNGKSPGYGAYLCIILSVGVFSAGLPYIADFENLYAVYTIFGIAACLTAAAIFRVVRRCCYLRALSGAFLPKEYEGVSKASLVWGKGAALSLFGICLFLPWMAILLCLDQLDLILSRLVDTFFSRISLTMPLPPKFHNTAYVLLWEEDLHWQSRSSGCSSS